MTDEEIIKRKRELAADALIEEVMSLARAKGASTLSRAEKAALRRNAAMSNG